MESIERKTENYAVVFNVNLIRATLNEAVQFKDYLAETIKGSEKDIIVNLSACEHLDSTFLGVLVSAYKRLKSQNRNLVIIEPVDQSSIFLTLNSIGKIFPLYTSVKVALEDIENKKLLEREITELSDVKTHPVTNPTIVSYKIDNRPFFEEKLEPITEATQTDEFKSEDILVSTSQEVSEMNQPEMSIDSVKEWNLIEHNSNESEMENSSALKVEEPNVNENVYELESSHAEESQIEVRQSRESNENSLLGGDIKWEFGFSS